MSVSTTTHAAVLALLATDAPEEELRAALDALGDDDAQLADAALALHRARLEDRRRAVGLGVLSDSAADLASHRDLDALLEAICRRARLLLGTDVAYITLGDPERGDTYVRTTDGIVSEAFRTMRLPAGVGIGGLVATTGRPRVTSDYAADAHLAHDRDVDDRVAAEGLRAIVAVPLRHGGETFGVLLSAARAVRRFDPQEVSLFGSLAAHAAAAIENARALAELAAHAARVERLGAAQERLAAVALDGGGLRELADAGRALLGTAVQLRGADGEHLAGDGGDAATPAGLELPLPGGPHDLGTLRLADPPADDVARDVADRVAALAAALLLQQRVQSEAEYRHRSRLLEGLLSDRGVDAGERRRLAPAGVALDAPHVVLVIAPPPAAERWAWLSATRAAEADHGLAGTVAGRIVAILPGEDAEAVAERWAGVLRGAGADGPTIGAADAGPGLDGLPAAHGQATSALELLLALGHAGGTATIARLGIFGHMLAEPTRADLRRLLERTLGPVLEHDRTGRSELLPVLEAFFDESGHLANTARRLHVHINTLYQRVERLDEVLGPGWREPDRRLELHLALRLRALDAQLRGGRPSSR